MRVGVIDYGTGNLGSMLRALEELGAGARLVGEPSSLAPDERLILPGVGNFTDCMGLLHAQGWVEALREAVVARGQPLLGICVGMQLLAGAGEEGAEGPEPTPGLGLVGGRVRHLRALGCKGRVPHVGWNAVSPTASGAGLFAGIPDATDFYFVHSYGFVVDDPSSLLATVDYGVPVAAAVRSGNVWGTQFHPEKSSRAGFRLLRNFLAVPGC